MGMNGIQRVALALVLIGAINWGLVGFFNVNLVDAIFGVLSPISRLIYALVGLAGLYCLTLLFMPAVPAGRGEGDPMR